MHSLEESVCPICGTNLVPRDWRIRVGITRCSEKKYYRLRRLYCPECKKIHLELPDILFPYKHYEAEAIENVIAGDDWYITVCPQTKARWRNWYKRNQHTLRMFFWRFLRKSGNLLHLDPEKLELIKVVGWTKMVANAIINSGEKVPT